LGAPEVSVLERKNIEEVKIEKEEEMGVGRRYLYSRSRDRRKQFYVIVFQKVGTCSNCLLSIPFKLGMINISSPSVSLLSYLSTSLFTSLPTSLQRWHNAF
jgi:hypothetical protein